MIRIAAAADVHFDRNSGGRLARHWQEMEGKADLFLIAGDLTSVGHPDEGEVLANDLKTCPVPVVAVLGNHDYHLDQADRIASHLTNAGVKVLERTSVVFHFHEVTVGIFGLKGFGGGFLGACASDFGEREMKAFVEHTKEVSTALREGLSAMTTDHKIVLLHYSPTPDTLLGERKEIYPFLGSYLLAEAIDLNGVDAVFHGHAHKGVEMGTTPKGVPVRNVAQPVIRHAFNIYALNEMAGERRTG